VRAVSCSAQPGKEDPSQQHSMYCWTVMQPQGHEPALLKLQQAQHWGIFACEGTVVFSSLHGEVNGVMAVGLGEDPTRVCMWDNVAYFCNTEFFIRAWQKLFEMQHYKDYKWVVKVDPDAAFFPSVLKQHISSVGDGKVVFLQNSDFPRMRGAIEVISTPAVQLFDRMSELCFVKLHRYGTSEDGFFSDCFAEVLQVPAHVDLALLSTLDSEGGCSSGAACYHALKTEHDLNKCYRATFAR